MSLCYDFQKRIIISLAAVAIPLILYGAFLAIFGAMIAIVAFTNSIATMLNFAIGLFMTSAGIVILIVSYREYVHINLELEDKKKMNQDKK